MTDHHDEAEHAYHRARELRGWATEEEGKRAASLLDAADVAEREAIAIEGRVPPERAREIAECELRWRRGGACTCGLHATEAP